MDDILTTKQIDQAFTAQIASAKKGKLALASAVRDCCRNLLVGETVQVATHVIKPIKAYCDTWGGRSIFRPGSYTKTVLLIDGRLAPEPRFEVEAPDSLEQGWPALWTGPEGGWYSVVALREYEQLREEYGGGVPIDPPSALKECSATALSEVAKALPAAMAPWCVQHLEKLADEASNSQALAVALRQRSDATTAMTSS